MAIDQHYIPAFSIEDVLLDKDTGAPLSGGKVYFEQDNQRGILKPVYQITGTSPNYTFVPLPNPVILSSIGTFEDALGNPVIPYFYPYDAELNPEYYYVRVLSSGDVPQFTRESVPYILNSPDEDVLSVITNELSNPQFVEVNFDNTSGDYVLNFSAVTDQVVMIAPNWDLIVSCPTTGTVTVNQLKPTGSLNIPTNPATIFNIASAGITKLQLRQRLYGSPNLWGNGYLSGTFVAKTYSGTSPTLNMYYSQSNGTVVDQLLVSASLSSSGNYNSYPGSILIPISNSADNFPDAYVDIYFDIPLSIEIDITSVMVAFTGATSIENIAYDQESYARQIDHLFNYYKVPLSYKPIPSLMTAWDFPLNPAQFVGSSVTMNTTAAYIWDQTICKSVVGNIAVVRNAVTGGFQATTANASEAFYQLQYLSGGQARKFLATSLSVNVNAFRTQAGGNCTVKVYLYRGSSAATIPTLPTSLGTINAAGEFTLTAANWTLIPRGNLGQSSGTLSVVNTGNYSTLNDVVDLQFTGWEITDAAQIANTDKVAVVVTYSCPTTGTVVVVDSIGVVPGDIPTRPAPQSFDEVVRECQYYYEKSTDLGVNPAVGSTNGAVACELQPEISGGAYNAFSRFLMVRYNTRKRRPVNPVFYTVVGVIDNVLLLIYQNATVVANANVAISGNWAFADIGEAGFNMEPTNRSVPLIVGVPGSPSFPGAEAIALFNWVADARLGIL